LRKNVTNEQQQQQGNNNWFTSKRANDHTRVQLVVITRRLIHKTLPTTNNNKQQQQYVYRWFKIVSASRLNNWSVTTNIQTHKQQQQQTTTKYDKTCPIVSNCRHRYRRWAFATPLDRTTCPRQPINQTRKLRFKNNKTIIITIIMIIKITTTTTTTTITSVNERCVGDLSSSNAFSIGANRNFFNALSEAYDDDDDDNDYNDDYDENLYIFV
jgi:hypothetical protein